jgi:hypothetical protein
MRYSFDFGSTYSGKDDYAYMEAFDWNSQDEVYSHIEILKEGLKIFEEVFGYKSKSFIAPCYYWDPIIESTLAEYGMECIQGVRTQLVPQGGFGKHKVLKHTFGQRNNFGMFYNVRNVFFEPTGYRHNDIVDVALSKIQAAFLLNKPAVISSHRINYIGSIDSENRSNGLRKLKLLLEKVIKKWPDVHFASTDELSNFII